MQPSNTAATTATSSTAQKPSRLATSAAAVDVKAKEPTREVAPTASPDASLISVTCNDLGHNNHSNSTTDVDSSLPSSPSKHSNKSGSFMKTITGMFKSPVHTASGSKPVVTSDESPQSLHDTSENTADENGHHQNKVARRKSRS